MGLFDDFLDMAKEFNGLRDDVTSVFEQVTSEATGIKDDVLQSKDEIISEAKSALNITDKDS